MSRLRPTGNSKTSHKLALADKNPRLPIAPSKLYRE